MFHQHPFRLVFLKIETLQNDYLIAFHILAEKVERKGALTSSKRLVKGRAKTTLNDAVKQSNKKSHASICMFHGLLISNIIALSNTHQIGIFNSTKRPWKIKRYACCTTNIWTIPKGSICNTLFKANRTRLNQ